MRLLLCLALILPASAWAKDAIKVDLISKAQKGQGQPALVVRAEVQLQRLVLEVVRSTDKKRLRLESGALAAGRQHQFPLELPAVGAATFEGKLTVEVNKQERGEMPIQVNAELLEPLAVVLKAEDVDLAQRTLRLGANRPLARVEISVMSDAGTPLGTTSQDLGGADAEGKFAASWEQGRGTVLRISVRASDADGFFGGVELFPWQVDIPHEEVHFRTGLSDIDPPEVPKLEASYQLIDQAIKKYGKLATIQLFIAGHTDTVGDPASNQVLSNQRARALGRWFRKRGIKIPIQYAGFGEGALLVETPDETDEVKNRRAEYIVAVEAPRMRGGQRFAPLE